MAPPGPGAGAQNICRGHGPAGAGAQKYAGAMAPPGPGLKSFAGALAPPGPGGKKNAGAGPGPRQTLIIVLSINSLNKKNNSEFIRARSA